MAGKDHCVIREYRMDEFESELSRCYDSIFTRPFKRWNDPWWSRPPFIRCDWKKVLIPWGIHIDESMVGVIREAAMSCGDQRFFMANLNADTCFAAFVANTWNTPVHIDVSRNGQPLAVESFTRIPQGTGPGLTYGNYDPAAGLPPGEVAILFLSGENHPSRQVRQQVGTTPQVARPTRLGTEALYGTE